MADEWRVVLQSARRRLGLSRVELARRTGLSVDTIRAYEQGRRRPSAAALTVITDALKVDRTTANQLRLELGYAPDTRDLGTPSVADQYSVEELQVELERLPWPSFAANEVMEVVAANAAAQRLWGVDLTSEFLELTERNLLRVASTPRFADHCLNWEEVVGVMVGMWKGHHRGHEDLDHPSPYFAKLIEDFMAGDPKYVKLVNRLRILLEEAEFARRGD